MTTDNKTLAVDVLAVMDREAKVARHYRIECGALKVAEEASADSSEASAAIAELIEASDRALIALAQAEEALERLTGIGQSINQLAANGDAEEYADLSAALARVKGESA